MSYPRVRNDFWIQNSRLFPDFSSKQKFLFPEPCLTIPLPATLASPLLSYHPYLLPSIPFPLPYHTLCLCITIPLPLHYHPPISCLTIPLWNALLSPSSALPPLTHTLYPLFSILYFTLRLCFTVFFPPALPWPTPISYQLFPSALPHPS